VVNIITRTSHYESFTMSGTSYILNAVLEDLAHALHRGAGVA
jgi:hypothetical protein